MSHVDDLMVSEMLYHYSKFRLMIFPCFLRWQGWVSKINSIDHLSPIETEIWTELGNRRPQDNWTRYKTCSYFGRTRNQTQHRWTKCFNILFNEYTFLFELYKLIFSSPIIRILCGQYPYKIFLKSRNLNFDSFFKQILL